MAQRIQTLLIDDLDGGDATETVSFALDGTTYEIDLSDKNAAALRKGFAKFLPVARKVSKGRPATNGSSKGSKATGPKPADVRAWANDNGHKVPERGRIPQEVQDAYAAAH